MANQITITQNDSGIALETYLVDANKKPFDLTGCTVNISIVAPDKTVLNRVAQIIDASAGFTVYILSKADTEQPELYKVFYEIVDSSSNITAQDIITYYVLPENGGV